MVGENTVQKMTQVCEKKTENMMHLHTKIP